MPPPSKPPAASAASKTSSSPTADPPPLTKSTHRTPNPDEKQFGYHRAVRKGPFIYVSGTASLIEGTRHVRLKNNARGQAIAAMEESVHAVEALGGQAGDVVRVRAFLAGDEHMTAFGRALKAVFGDAEVAATVIVIPGGFVDPEMLVQVEVDAVVG